jgi:hypothetical protein
MTIPFLKLLPVRTAGTIWPVDLATLGENVSKTLCWLFFTVVSK